jgi:hypothetical protein
MSSPSGLTDREAAIDAVLHFVEGLDDGDASPVRSAFTVDATVDLSSISNIGLPFSALRVPRHDRRQAAEERWPARQHASRKQFPRQPEGCVSDVDLLRTLAQHFRTGQGPSPEHRGYFLMGNRYQADLEGEVAGEWRIRRLVVKCAWSDGDISVLKKET